MPLLHLLVLAVIQGLTEFLPVSSDGHLAIGRFLLGDRERTGLVVELALHAGTLGALLVAYRDDWGRLLAGSARPGATGARRLLGLLVLGTIPAAVAGLLFKDRIEAMYTSPRAVAVGLFATAVALALGALASRRARREFETVGAVDVLLVGIAQAFALVPGLSRSGITIAAALGRGLRPVAAAKLSFLLAVPVIAGACALGAFDWARGHDVAEAGPWALVAGVAVAWGVGTWALRACVGLVVRNRLPWFVGYCVLAGLGTLLFLPGRATNG